MRVCAALLLAGCAPVVVWHGRSPDRAHEAIVLEENGRQRVSIDGAQHASWDAVGFSHLAWSDRGAVYPAMAGDRWRVVIAGRAGPAYEAIGEIAAHDSHVAYAALDADGWHVVLDGRRGPPYRSLRAHSLRFSPEGRFTYIGRDARGERAVVDGVPGPPFDRVEGLSLGAKGNLIAYIGHRRDKAQIVVDGRAGEEVDDVRELVLAPDEPRWAAIIVREERRFVVHDGMLVSPPSDSHAELVIARDGRHVAWLGDDADRSIVWRDGQRVAAHEGVAHLRFVPRTNVLLYVAEQDGAQFVVHGSERSPPFRSVEPPVVSDAGHWGYVAERGVGRVVVIDGMVRFRGEWAGGLALAAHSDRWAFVARRAGQRAIVTPDARTRIPRPFVDTLVLDESGRHWAIAIADRRTRRIDVLVDGRRTAPLDFDEIAAAMQTTETDPRTVVRTIVAGELRRATR